MLSFRGSEAHLVSHLLWSRHTSLSFVAKKYQDKDTNTFSTKGNYIDEDSASIMNIYPSFNIDIRNPVRFSVSKIRENALPTGSNLMLKAVSRMPSTISSTHRSMSSTCIVNVLSFLKLTQALTSHCIRPTARRNSEKNYSTMSSFHMSD